MLSAVTVLVGTCTLKNLPATGEAENLIRGLSKRCLICDIVATESMFLRDEFGDRAEQRIDVSPLPESGVLGPCRAESPAEEELFVSLAAELEDGEALSLAISVVRGWGLATDDRKARRLATEIGVTALFTTPEILHFDKNFCSTETRNDSKDCSGVPVFPLGRELLPVTGGLPTAPEVYAYSG